MDMPGETEVDYFSIAFARPSESAGENMTLDVLNQLMEHAVQSGRNRRSRWNDGTNVTLLDMAAEERR